MELTLDTVHPVSSSLTLTSLATGPCTHYDHEDSDGGDICRDSGWGCAWRCCINVANSMDPTRRLTMKQIQSACGGLGLIHARTWLDNLDMYELLLRWCLPRRLRVRNTIFLPEGEDVVTAQMRLTQIRYSDIGKTLYCPGGLLYENVGARLFGSEEGFADALAAGEDVISGLTEKSPSSPQFGRAHKLFVSSFDSLEHLQSQTPEQLRAFWRAVVCFDQFYCDPQHTVWVTLQDPIAIAEALPHFVCSTPQPVVLCDGTYTNNVYGTAIDAATNTAMVYYVDVHHPRVHASWRRLSDVLSPHKLLQTTHFSLDTVLTPLPGPKVVPPMRTGALYLERIRTEIVCVGYSDRIMVAVTQLGRPAGTVLMCTAETNAAAAAVTYTVEPLLGNREEGVECLLGRQLIQTLHESGVRRPILLCVALKPPRGERTQHLRREDVLRILHSVLSLKVW